MPGLKSLPPAFVAVRAPEHARLALFTPPPICTSAACERWQPRIASPVGVSQYAREPSASTFELESFVLPAQRPASPEIAESPSATIAGVPEPGPSAHAVPPIQQPPTATTHATRPRRTAYLPLDEPTLRRILSRVSGRSDPRAARARSPRRR